MTKEWLVGIAIVAIGAMVFLGAVDPEGRLFEASDQIQFIEPFRFDPRGHDILHLNEEVVTLQNPSEEPVDMSGWRLRNERWNEYRFPEGFILGAGEWVTIHTGCGEDTAQDLFWCSAMPVWNDEYGEAYLALPTGRVVSSHTYGSKEDCKDCGRVVRF